MGKIRCGRVLDVEGPRELIELTKHAVRALSGNNDLDNSPNELSTRTPRVGGHAPLSARWEAR